MDCRASGLNGSVLLRLPPGSRLCTIASSWCDAATFFCHGLRPPLRSGLRPPLFRCQLCELNLFLLQCTQACQTHHCHKCTAPMLLFPQCQHRFCNCQCPLRVAGTLLAASPARTIAASVSPFSDHDTGLERHWLFPPVPSWRPRLNCGFRFGEASNPGPGQTLLTSYFGDKPGAGPQRPPSGAPRSLDPSMNACVISVINPTSVLHKAALFSETQADILTLAVRNFCGRTGSGHHRPRHAKTWIPNALGSTCCLTLPR